MEILRIEMNFLAKNSHKKEEEEEMTKRGKHVLF